MSDDSKGGSEYHAAADSDRKTLAQEQLPICLAFCNQCGGDYEEYTGNVSIVSRLLATEQKKYLPGEEQNVLEVAHIA